MRISRTLLKAALLVLVAARPSAAATFLEEHFNGATFPPAGWTVVDNGGSGVVWSNVAGSLETGNYTSGTGDAASVSSDKMPSLEFDTELRTPSISLPGTFSSKYLHFVANYQDRGSLDRLQVEVATDGGNVWLPVTPTWNENHGSFRSQSGVCVDESVAILLGGATSAIVRFRYLDASIGDLGWYAQIDDVVLDEQSTRPCPIFTDGFASGNTSVWSATMPPPSASPAGGEPDVVPGERQRDAEVRATGRERQHLRRRWGWRERSDGQLAAPSDHRAPPPASRSPER